MFTRRNILQMLLSAAGVPMDSKLAVAKNLVEPSIAPLLATAPKALVPTEQMIAAVRQLGGFFDSNEYRSGAISDIQDSYKARFQECDPRELFLFSLQERRSFELNYSQCWEVDCYGGAYYQIYLDDALQELNDAFCGADKGSIKVLMEMALESSNSNIVFSPDIKPMLQNCLINSEDPIAAIKATQKRYCDVVLRGMDIEFNEVMDSNIISGRLKVDPRKPEVINKLFKNVRITAASSIAYIPKNSKSHEGVFFKALQAAKVAHEPDDIKRYFALRGFLPSYFDLTLNRWKYSGQDLVKATAEIAELLTEIFPPYCFDKNKPHIHGVGKIRVCPGHLDDGSKKGLVATMLNFFNERVQNNERSR